MTKDNRIMEIFEQTGAITHGHFLLTSGRHSDCYVQCAQVLQYPYYTEQLVQELGKKLPGDYDMIVGPAMGGVILSYEMARYYNVKAVFSERQKGKMTFRRGFEISPGQKVLVVEDVVTTGGSVQEVIDLVNEKGAIVSNVAALVDRSGGNISFSGVENGFVSLIEMNIKSYEEQDCPLCEQGSTPVKPGSRNIDS
ncbi:orotate phosphoribosyltransferase [Natranaerobius thermophilus]|uniref:Orotate phosphoribosyltransferase n=1 Tax=Natranaerobius thermophilus (strain ATCC BAA-1301 / DSM 18059 / JW/NM-WN-LF) TaxID=457570 RepID=B2A2U2_NATTJ|nr:orotate phosphoribosyltransferase [Natranaerobius thermophilus]ACB86310.1 orotate phosphoribosyltransferase [Natranaerobius thermophilus JW/NM-WN-LF]